MNTKRALTIFTRELPKGRVITPALYDVVVAPIKLKEDIVALGCEFSALESLVDPGSIYEASNLADELSRLVLPNGTRLVKSFIYEGYELWWTNYQNLYSRFCLPYTQYRRLLEYLTSFGEVCFSEPQFQSLFSCYLRVYNCKITVLPKQGVRAPSWLPFGMVVQIALTFIFLPLLVVQRKKILVSTGDKFEASKDYDFRMRFIYEELRHRQLPFVEFIRSLESWKTILDHAVKRRRPVLYSEAIVFLGRFLSTLTGGHRRAWQMYGLQNFTHLADKSMQFKLYIASQYLLTAYDDIASIRMMRLILRAIGVRVAIVPATTERNFQTVLGCKLNNIPTVGILHGVASRYYNLYEFTPGFDGEKRISVDRYGVWSEWWKEYFSKYSRAYRADQISISGPMRPIQRQDPLPKTLTNTKNIKVLFVSEVVAVPTEVIPYLDALIKTSDFSVFIKFRATHDNFETWLKDNRPDILSTLGSERLLKESMHEAITVCDITVGCQSTGVIEATIQEKPFVFFNTKKWGDYFDMKSFDARYHFFAETPENLITCVREGVDTPVEVLRDIQHKFFGNPYKNGSAWVVDQVIELIRGR